MADHMVVGLTACFLWMLPVAFEAKLTYIAIRLPLKVNAIIPLHLSDRRDRDNLNFIKTRHTKRKECLPVMKQLHLCSQLDHPSKVEFF